MRSQSILGALVLATLLTAPLTQAALADPPEQQAMHQNSSSDASTGYSNGAGPYDTLAPTQGN
ncbi:MAG TPA: hypothetical protein VGR79_09730 [Stellaceae bacterium]|nr:hypothetical protein [Stellaceae bacterium]